MTSAYPLSVDELTDRVRDQATELGTWPSQRQVMRECHVGARRDAALVALRAAGFDPTTPAAPAPPSSPPPPPSPTPRHVRADRPHRRSLRTHRGTGRRGRRPRAAPDTATAATPVR